MSTLGLGDNTDTDTASTSENNHRNDTIQPNVEPEGNAAKVVQEIPDISNRNDSIDLIVEPDPNAAKSVQENSENLNLNCSTGLIIVPEQNVGSESTSTKSVRGTSRKRGRNAKNTNVGAQTAAKRKRTTRSALKAATTAVCNSDSIIEISDVSGPNLTMDSELPDTSDPSNITLDLELPDVQLNSSLDCELPDILGSSNSMFGNKTTKSRGRGRGRGRQKRQTVSKKQQNQIDKNTNLNLLSRYNPNYRTPILNCGLRDLLGPSRSVYDYAPTSSPQVSSSSNRGLLSSYLPTYSIGNTDYYPDQSETQKLFGEKPKEKTAEVVELDDDSVTEDNEELSVKVNWQSFKIHLFKIRKYQKITQIYDYFSKQENVDHKYLLFTYSDKILKPDDTPDSIEYSLAKFIEGGVLSNAITRPLDTNDASKSKTGLKIKFQCQNVKKPFETYIEPYEKLLHAMTKCAEHLERPLSDLKFTFDGDAVASTQTPKDLEFEGEECIDVKISSRS